MFVNGQEIEHLVEMEGDGLNFFSSSWNQQIIDFIEPKTDNFSLYFEFCR